LTVHEDLTRAVNVKGSSDRSFGVTVAAFFALIAMAPVLHGQLSSFRWWAAIIAAAFLALALFWSDFLRPLNRLWRKLGLALSKIIGPIVLTLVFFAVVTPVGLLMRAVGTDPLRLRRRVLSSYWIARQPAGPNAQSMKNQF
jgi:Saxitoxin biosynthesis operon protein SxtJ